jgi:hypothetical protein
MLDSADSGSLSFLTFQRMFDHWTVQPVFASSQDIEAISLDRASNMASSQSVEHFSRLSLLTVATTLYKRAPKSGMRM